MNQKTVLFHLKEAKGELDRTIADIERDPAYDVGEFSVAMGHLYHHLNTSWNGRDASDAQHQQCTQLDFDAWRQFPSEAELGLESADA